MKRIRITVGRNMWALLEPIGGGRYQVMMVNRIPQLKVGCLAVDLPNGNWVAWEPPSPTPAYRFPSRSIVESVPTHGGEEE